MSHEHLDEPQGEAAQSPETEPQPRPCIWAGSWLDYNAGVLHGAWLAADRDVEEISAYVAAMLAASPTSARTGEVAEEWGIFDYDHFGPLRLGEQEDLEWLSRVARGITEHGPAFAAWASTVPHEAGGADFPESYLGHYDSVEAYAEQLWDDLGYQPAIDVAVPENLRPYVRAALLARDLQLGGDISVIPADDSGVWIFTPG